MITPGAHWTLDPALLKTLNNTDIQYFEVFIFANYQSINIVKQDNFVLCIGTKLQHLENKYNNIYINLSNCTYI